MTSESYIAASVFPSKLLHTKVIDDKGFIPVHLQLVPTNACNLSCDFCSCSDVDRSKSLTLEEMRGVIDVVSERGGKAITMSLDGDEIIPIEKNGFIKLVEIREFVKNFDKKDRYFGWTLNDNHKKDKIEDVFSHKKKGDMYKITLESGRTITTTGDHSIYFYNGKIFCKNVRDVNVGDDVVLSKITLPTHKTTIDTSKFYNGNRGRGIKNPLEIKIDKGLCRLLGYFIAEGCRSKDNYSLTFTFGKYEKYEKRYVDDLVKIIKNLGFKDNYSVYKYHNKTQIRIWSKWFCEMMESLGTGDYSQLKRVPDIILNTSKKNKIEFLKGLFGGDGNFRSTTTHKKYKRNTLCLKTSSKKLIQSMVFLLDGLDIFSTILKGKNNIRYFGDRRVNESTYYSLNINRRIDLLKIKDVVSFIGGKLQYKDSKFSCYKPKIQSKQINKDAYTLRVKKIEKIKFEGEVYDISIKNSHRFITSFGILAHNTGGGEPLIHPKINDVIDYAGDRDMEVGLTTNGVLLDKLEHHKNLTWCRISSSDDRTPNYEAIERALKTNPETDWAFAHVVTRNPNYDTIRDINSLANIFKFSHVKIHPDLFDIDNVPMGEVKKFLKTKGRRVIYQDRENITEGTKDCYIGLVKPMVSPEGVFPCCGAQYAIKGQRRDMVDKMKIGEVSDLASILDSQKPFKGKICDICYYSQYNNALSKLKETPKHRSFI